MKGTNPEDNSIPSDNANSTDNAISTGNATSSGKPKKDETGKDDLRHYNKVYDLIYNYCLKVLWPFVVAFINTIFHVNHPLDSRVDFLDTSSVGENFDRLYSDSYVRITETANCESKMFDYVIEFETYFDYTIGFRLYEYGGRLAIRSKRPEDGVIHFQYPPAAAITLFRCPNDRNSIVIDTSGQNGQPNQPFVVNVISLFDRSFDDNAKDLFLLLPFEILRHRDEILKNPTDENVTLLLNDYQTIKDTLRESIKGFSLSQAGFSNFANALYRLFIDVYKDLPPFQKGGKYEMSMTQLLEDYNLINAMTAMEEDYINRLSAKDDQIAAKDNQIAAKDDQIADKDAQIADKDAQLAQQAARIADLERQLTAATSKPAP